MSAALRKMLQSDEKRKQLTQALLENDLFTKRDPEEVFEIVHRANMGKIFPDGKAHFDPVTHKILKPDDWEEKYAPEPAIKKELDRQLKAYEKHAKQKEAKKQNILIFNILIIFIIQYTIYFIKNQ